MEVGDDCHFYYNLVCSKGDACQYRHVAEAKNSDVTCENWRMGRCHVPKCNFRHTELRPPCYFETQPGGCTKPICTFQHKYPKTTTVASSAVSGPPVALPPAPSVGLTNPPPTSGVAVPPPARWMPPRHARAPPPGPWAGRGPPPGPGFFPGQRPPGRPHFRPYGPDVRRPFPREPVPMLFPGHPRGMMPVHPVVINPNEDSDMESSPLKQTQRSVVPPSIQPPKMDNPLDYFLNAKPYVDPNPQRSVSRSPSPAGRTSPYRKRSSLSPIRHSPRRSLSPDVGGRRRSLSAERHDSGFRRRSGSLDRSRSPDWRDRRRFGRRSRSPPRRRSRSPGRNRAQGVLNRHRVDEQRGAKLEEVKVSGPKIVSLKKDRKEKEADEATEDKKEEESQEKAKEKETDKGPVVEEEVKSLEEIYRERALMSMMEAKRKKVLENKRKRWEAVNSSSSHKSESEKSDKSEKSEKSESQQTTVDEKGDNSTQEEEDSSSDSPEEEGGSDIDFNEDVDIELGEGEIEPADEQTEESDHEQEIEPDDTDKKPSKKPQSKVTSPAKPSVKSRLGQRALEDVTKQAMTNKPRSIKDRLGLRTIVPEDSDKPLRSGVIKLNKSNKSKDILSRIDRHRELRGTQSENNKTLLMVPQITIKNRLEDRKTNIKHRLGLLDAEYDSDSRKDRKRKKDIDKELMKLLEEEDADIEFDDLELLSKKEKKKLLKKLLAQQGREDEYESFKKKKKRGFRKKRERFDIDEEGDRERKRRINIKSRLGPALERDDGSEEGEELVSGDEIQLDEEGLQDEAENSPEKETVEEQEEEEEVEAEDTSADAVDAAPVKSQEEIRREQAEKEERLREALEPKTLEDIRRERAIKRARGEEVGGLKISTGQNRRKIVIAEEEEKPVEKPEPAVKVTFGGTDPAPRRKLLRLGGNPEPAASSLQVTTGGRTTRKERQIYIPPVVKKTEEPLASIRKPVDPTKGRDIVDYSDMYIKKSASVPDVTIKKITTKITPPSTEPARPPLRLQKGPAKVEVKDATVKTFAEIMAEKKRKRLEAQKTAKKAYTPITFDDSELSSGPTAALSREDPILTSDSSQDVPDSSSVNSSPVKAQLKTLGLKKKPSQDSINTDVKPTRWKRRKLHEQNVSSGPSDVVESESRKSDSVVSAKAENDGAKEVIDSKNPGLAVLETWDSSKSVPTKRRISDEKPDDADSGPSVEKKAQIYESILDFDDDDLLNLEDNDLELNTSQDHDELLREMDELLS